MVVDKISLCPAFANFIFPVFLQETNVLPPPPFFFSACEQGSLVSGLDVVTIFISFISQGWSLLLSSVHVPPYYLVPTIRIQRELKKTTVSNVNQCMLLNLCNKSTELFSNPKGIPCPKPNI